MVVKMAPAMVALRIRSDDFISPPAIHLGKREVRSEVTRRSGEEGKNRTRWANRNKVAQSPQRKLRDNDQNRLFQLPAGCGKTEVRQPISHDRSRRISGLRCEMGVRPRFFRNLHFLRNVIGTQMMAPPGYYTLRIRMVAGGLKPSSLGSPGGAN